MAEKANISCFYVTFEHFLKDDLNIQTAFINNKLQDQIRLKSLKPSVINDV